MTRKFALLLIFSSLATLLLIACGSTAGPDTGTSTSQVHMNSTNFVQSSITIKKGESITLIADTFMTHSVANGTWDGTTPKPSREPGAPTVNNVQISGNSSQTIGPFTSAGTFHLYCPIHPRMNLTIIVQ
jgi:plastocyanin